MNLPSWHKHVSEREPDGTWEDCTWDSGIEWMRLTHDKSIPATHTEAQALRKASGEPATGGSNIGDLRRGIQARYKWTPPAAIAGFANLWQKLLPGYAAVVQGSMAAFGPTHSLSKWDRNFDGGHAVMVIRLDTTDRVWWCDPEAPLGIGYKGVWVSKDDLRKFVAAFNGQHLLGKVLAEPVVPPPPIVTGDDMPALTSYTPGHVATIKPQSNIRNSTKIVKESLLRTITTAETREIIGTVKGDVDPANGSDVWYIWWNAGRFEYTAKDNITGVLDPAVAAAAQLEAARAAAKAASTSATAANTALAAANAKIAKAKADLA